MKRIKSSRIILPDGLFAGYLYFDAGKIQYITDRDLPCSETYDAGDHYVSAGFIDIHTHGGGGHDFGQTAASTLAAAEFHRKHGTTTICPTISAAPLENMARSARYVQEAMRQAGNRLNILGAHLEGPYLSQKQCGAQCPDFLTPPEPERYQPLVAELGGAIARWTYAPENDTDGRFCDFLVKNGIVPSAGHTDAVYADMALALQKGCKLITHLYSCTSTITRQQGFRRLGVVETAYLEDDLFVEIIADGKHLPPDLIRLIVKIKGADKVILVTDSLSLAGTDSTHGFMEQTEYIIEDGVCKLMDRSAFAGSIATADRLIRVCVLEAGIDICEAVKMMTANPAKAMGLDTKGSLAPGFDADIVVFDDRINIRKVFVNGIGVE